MCNEREVSKCYFRRRGVDEGRQRGEDMDDGSCDRNQEVGSGESVR